MHLPDQNCTHEHQPHIVTMRHYINLQSLISAAFNNVDGDYNKRTECGPPQFGSSRERIVAVNAANAQSSTVMSVERAASKGQL